MQSREVDRDRLLYVCARCILSEIAVSIFMSRLLLPSYTCVCRHIQKARNFNSHNWQARSRLQCTSLGSQSWYRIASKSSSQPLTEEPVRQRSLITLASEDVQPAAAAGRSRQYPDEPRVSNNILLLKVYSDQVLTCQLSAVCLDP